MNPTCTSVEPVSPSEPSVPYSVTPEIVPDCPSPTGDDTKVPTDRKGAGSECRIDSEAYNALTKPDPHWATILNHSDVRGERWDGDYLYLDREKYFKMLAEINRGEKNGPVWEHSELHTYQSLKFLVENLGHRLNMTDQQIERTIARATNIDTEKFGRKLELAVFCTCAYVVHRDETGYAKDRYYHPNKEEKDDLFESVADEFELSQHEIDNAYREFDQKFTDMIPPVRFDKRKPDWKPNQHSGKQIFASPSKKEPKRSRWRGGI